MTKNWHKLSKDEVISELQSNSGGLTVSEVGERLKKYGANSIPEKKGPPVVFVFFSQFRSPLIYILLIASVITYFISGHTDAYIILFILIFNAVIGAIQEGRAQNTLLALKKYIETKATVLRAGIEIIVNDYELVPGDIIEIEEGEKVPADVRLIFSYNLKVNESSLTGESEPVDKIDSDINQDDVPISDQKNMLFKGTSIVSGNGRAIVVATGLNTYIGKIAREISSIDTDLPLKSSIRFLSKMIILIVSIISALLFAIGIYRGEPVSDMFAVVISLVVSVIPEGLPIVITLVLATGVWRMSKRNVLVKKLQAVEALGQAQVIAVDKTGTITKNEMVVREIWVDENLYNVTGEGYEPKGDVMLDGALIDLNAHHNLKTFSMLLSLCANARLLYSEEKGKWTISGDPTNGALLVFSQKLGDKKIDSLLKYPVLSEIPFNYKLKYRAVVNLINDKKKLIVLGAPEIVLESLVKMQIKNELVDFNKSKREEVEKILNNMLQKGLRVLAVAVKDIDDDVASYDDVSGLTLVGFVGMKDVLRMEVLGAMKRAREAGIRVVMITGDHKITAVAIAKEAGIYKEGDGVLTGEEIESMNEYELSDKVKNTSVFARVTPEHKYSIISSFKSNHQIIAMTGDGVNDAPSLVAADLGVAMGNIGTEVAKESADIILLDDNFGSIVSGIEEGRSIYKTIKKVITYLFSTGLGEVLTITVALILGLPLPLVASQIIWLNFVTDGFLTLAISMEPKEKDLLSKNYIQPSKYIVDRLMTVRMIVMSFSMMIGTLFLFQYYLDFDIKKAWTVSLTTLAVLQWFNAWNCRSEDKSMFSMNPFSNLYLVLATVIVVVLQILAVYTPFMQKILHTTALDSSDWILIVAVSLLVIIVEEIRKAISKEKFPSRAVVKLSLK